jgi:hypothetical protein
MNRLLLHTSILFECLKGIWTPESASLGRDGNPIHLLPRRMSLYITRMQTSDEVDIHQPLQCGESSLNKFHSMPPKTESHGRIRPSQEQQKGPMEQVLVAVAPHWGYCTDFAALPLQSRDVVEDKLHQAFANSASTMHILFTSDTRKMEGLHVQESKKGVATRGDKLPRTGESQEARW